jgi:[ribosomal protein S5]-alanine N-acetyltransferase
MIACETQRLRLRHLTTADAAFILELLNEPDFIRNIGDREVRTLDDARRYIVNGPIASYQRHGFGLFAVELKDSSIPIGICGLLRRDYLDDVDVGFALLASYRGAGYAFEAASATMRFGKEVLGLERIVAITAPENDASIKVVRRLGLEFERMIRVPDQTRDTRLFTPAGAQSLLDPRVKQHEERVDEEGEAGGSQHAETGRSDR